MIFLTPLLPVRAVNRRIVVLQRPINTHIRHIAAVPMGALYQQAAWRRKHHAVPFFNGILKTALKLVAICPVTDKIWVVVFRPSLGKQPSGQQIQI